ncbi:MAG TPA: nucleotidyltransferase family protein [Desulfobacteraceae bacterium]|nr:nucleotidyltransferase family protein [Desulfobacteraceae bacterium]
MKYIPGILLGAGGSERFGSEKLLASLPSGETLFERALGIHLQSQILPLIVVVSPSLGKIIRQKTEIFAFSRLKMGKRFDTWHAFSCKWGDGRLIINENFHKGMSSSIKKGVGCLTDDEKAGGIVVSLADLPLLSSKTINFFINKFLDERVGILLPVFKDITGHPVIVDFNRFKNDIAKLRGDVGLRSLLKKYPKAVKKILWHDDSVIWDIDTPQDLKRLEVIN